MLPRETHLFGGTRSNPDQGSVPAGLTLGCDFSFCFQCQVGSSLVLRRPIEITAFNGTLGIGGAASHVAQAFFQRPIGAPRDVSAATNRSERQFDHAPSKTNRHTRKAAGALAAC
jgi:hypothetical protein